jgi:hypothetical protein
VVDEDPAHGLGGRGVKVAAAGPGCPAVLGKSEENLVDQRGGLQGVVAAFPTQTLLGDPAELVIDQFHEMLIGATGLGGVRFHGPQNTGGRRFGLAPLRLVVGPFIGPKGSQAAHKLRRSRPSRRPAPAPA